jgi:hypothetical protein
VFHCIQAGQDPSARRCAYLDQPAATSGGSRRTVYRDTHTEDDMTTSAPSTRRPRRREEPTPAQVLREAITPYIALPRLRRLVAEHGDLAQALRCPTPPQDVAVLELLRAMLQPNPRDQIKRPTDAAESIL